MDDKEYSQLKTTILKLIDIDLEGYKSHQMRRRLEGFIARSKEPNVDSYCKMLEINGDSLTKLRDFLTINVSEFFRDKEQFDVLSTHILPDLLRRSRRLNIWSAGCSHGAEPYSVAILLNELTPNQKHRILATDIDNVVLTKARAGGPYTQSDIKNVKHHIITKYFTESDAGYKVADWLKQKVEFKQHNLFKDPFETGFDMIICRNVVIYFSDEFKNKLYQGFYNSLKGNGIFFSGGTETLLGCYDFKFTRLHTSFHQKPASSTPLVNNNNVRDVSGVKR
ncbi:MAG: protein-glutamate O-methyltransferase CheR [Chloroflexota bacterium]|nr:protein-glutamate O-methyltransferase CheR [Chloroflexota bacterium]